MREENNAFLIAGEMESKVILTQNGFHVVARDPHVAPGLYSSHKQYVFKTGYELGRFFALQLKEFQKKHDPSR